MKLFTFSCFLIVGDKALADTFSLILSDGGLYLINLVCQYYVINRNDLSGDFNTLHLYSLDVKYVSDNSKLACVFPKLDGDEAAEFNESRVHHVKLKARSGNVEKWFKSTYETASKLLKRA